MAVSCVSDILDGPAILQLQKWGPSGAQLNLSEFHEAFISPTREFLLLLSYQCEALLIPLLTGESTNKDHPGRCDSDSIQGSSSFDSSSPLAASSGSDSDVRHTSETLKAVSDGEYSLKSRSSRSKNYSVLCGVKSLAWGHCGDAYNQHKKSSFTELLFVSGENDITVHAFRYPEKTNEVTIPLPECVVGEGRWVEWGSPTSDHSIQTSGNILLANGTIGREESSNDVSGLPGNDESSTKISASNERLCTFLTKVETTQSEGKYLTRFPARPSFPCSAEVVSFSIFDSIAIFLDFLSCSSTVSDNKKNCEEAVLQDSLGDPLVDPNSSLLDPVVNSGSSFKCLRVFSSSSHHLIGFVLRLEGTVVSNSTEDNAGGSSKVLVLISAIHQCGIQWVCSVKLNDSYLSHGPEFEWTDFKFSDNLVLCLNASGLIFVYSATTGELVERLDIVQICGLNPKSKREQEQSYVNPDLASSADIQTELDYKIHSKTNHQIQGNLCTKRSFKRLMVTSSSSLVAAVDERGVIFLVGPGDYTSDKYYSFNKLPQHYFHFGLGILVGWEVGGSEIGHQRESSDLSNYRCLNKSSMKTGSFPLRVNDGYIKSLPKRNAHLQGKRDGSCLSGFSAASVVNDDEISPSRLSLNPMRRIFLPREGCNQDDSICFSSLGITRLTKTSGINDAKGFKIVHTPLHVASAIHDDESLKSRSLKCGALEREEVFMGEEALGCFFQGCLYLVTQNGLSIVLPSVSVSSSVLPVEAVGYRGPSMTAGNEDHSGHFLGTKTSKKQWPLWKIEVLDRVLLYEGPEEADRMCLENGWDLKIARLRRLQLALDYLKPDEIERSLEMLADVNLAEEGILRLLLTVVYQIFCRVGSDNEVALASRLLALAASFATKMVRKYGLLQHKKGISQFESLSVSRIASEQTISSDRELNGMTNSRRLHEMAHFLEVIRSLQCRLGANFRKLGQGLDDGRDMSSLVDRNSLQGGDTHLPIPIPDAVPSELQNQQDAAFPSEFVSTAELALMPVESLETHMDSGNFNKLSILPTQGELQGRMLIPLENPKDMIARWKIENLDLKTVVKDALHSGRLPLAVLQLHLQRFGDLVNEKEPHDTFNEVRDVARAIAYDLLLKGETSLAVATLQRLGEDIEISLKQLLYGTVRRSLRLQTAEELKRFGYLGPYEWKMLERISLIERLYPSSSFWRTFLGRKKENSEAPSSLNLPETKLQLRCVDSFNNYIFECGEIDGVVVGLWSNLSESSPYPLVEEDITHSGYWAAAAIWSDAWDQRTIDRIVLDQPLLMGVHVLWESQLEYHICHNDWEEVCKLLDMIPSSVLCDGNLQINLDGLQPAELIGSNTELPPYKNFICSPEELDAVCMNIPNIKVLKFSGTKLCSVWLKVLMEQELAKRSIFLKEYWDDTTEIIPILARAGLIIKKSKMSSQDGSNRSLPDLSLLNIDGELGTDTVQALHKLVIHHCARYDLPNLLDLYLDHHKLVLDDDSLGLLQEAAGDCEWAKWLLLSRIKGSEYDASLSNARAIISKNIIPGSKLGVLDIDEIIRTVDDIAEGGGEMAALATLMYAPSPIQKCLFSGSVNRHYNSSAQCTLENLRPALQRFPTLWRSLIAACFGQEANVSSLGPSSLSVFGNSPLSDYLSWRENVFSSSGRDTSLVQMLPCWFSKAMRRLIQLFVQGPFGWQSLAGLPSGESNLHRDINFFINLHENAEVSALSWEAAIQKSVEKELYATAFQDTAFGVEHHLHRGRALAAFNHLLGLRVQKLKSENSHRKQSASSVQGQASIQSDVQILLAPVTQSEESLLSSVMPLAISNFEDSVLVASCAFLLELCGLPASMLRVDVAALRRISSFYKSSDSNEHFRHLSPKGSAFHIGPHEGDITVSLARALADDYLQHDNASIIEQEETPSKVAPSRRPSRALAAVLQHLEKASLPLMVDGRTCGYWLLSGSGDGTEFRSQQKAASQHWSLVTAFCQMHQIPLSTKYLAVLAKDNDWVGFLTEAQVAGYPFDATIQVASKEFSDPRLKIHILTVLKSMYSTKKKSSSSSNSVPRGQSIEMAFSTENNVMVPVELFGLLAECEKQKSPGEALLVKAKDLRWSLLAMMASCFPDVSPLACLTVWLEITAARETSSIKVNDIASQIANSVASAVEATNVLPPGGKRTLTFRYNRRNAKRRCLIEPTLDDLFVTTPTNVSSGSGVVRISIPADPSVAERKKVDDEEIQVSTDPDEGLVSLSKMVAVLCEQRLFLPLLRAFEMFLPSCTLLPFIRSLQAFSQMRLSEASAHLASFSARIKEEPVHIKTNVGREGQIGVSWISSTAVKAADAMLSTCPSAYEKRCLLQLLAATDFGDGGSAATFFRRLYWKINLAEPSLRKEDDFYLGNDTLDDASLLTALEKNGHWEQARNWARQLETSGAPWKSAAHHVTETQAEAMVAEWKEFLWDVPEERAALWGHCQTLFLRYSFPAMQAGLFFLKHAEAVEIPARELHEVLLLAIQWLSGTITQSSPVYPLHLLREIETRVWLLAVESEAQMKCEGAFTLPNSSLNLMSGNNSSIIERTASIITKMDNHLNTMRIRATEKNDTRESNLAHLRNTQALDASPPAALGVITKSKRRAKNYMTSRRSVMDATEKNNDFDDGPTSPLNVRNNIELFKGVQEENIRMEASVSKWEERVGPEELERAVLSLLEFGQIAAAQQLQHKLSPSHVPSEFLLVDAALNLAAISTPTCIQVPRSTLDAEVISVIQSYNILGDNHLIDPLQILESLAARCTKDGGAGLCKRIIAVVKAANVLGLPFSEAFGKRPLELLQLLSLKAQDSLEEAKLLVQTHSMPPASIAQVLAESFLKGLLAAHRGGYMDFQKEEGPAPLLWRLSDFLKWAELCPSEPEIGHALMRLVITGQEIPHACEVELLILSHHFYKSSACLDGVDVLVALAATRVESYVSEGDFSCLARLVTGVSNFHALNFILGILIENGQLELLLQKYSSADTATGTAESVRGFRLAVLTSLKHFNPHDLDAFAMVYNHFDMKHETASLLESQAIQSMRQWFLRYDKDQNEDLLESMRYFIEAAEVHSTIDAGNKTRNACAQASLLSLQIRMPDFHWLNLSETNARRALVEQSRFQEALIVAEAYSLNQPGEWALVLWNQMLKPELTEQFVAEFVAVLPLQPSMLVELARFYRAEVAARGDQSHFSVWLSPGGLPAEWLKHLGRSFRSLLRRTRDLRLRLQLATAATGFSDVLEACFKALDKVPETAGPLVLRKGHGGAYLPLM